MRDEVVDDPIEDANRRVHELVDGGADDQDHGVRPLQQSWVGRELEQSGGKQPLQQFFRPVLEERDAAGSDLLDLDPIDVVDADFVPAVGEREG